jgi:hypothetical protein
VKDVGNEDIRFVSLKSNPSAKVECCIASVDLVWMGHSFSDATRGDTYRIDGIPAVTVQA